MGQEFLQNASADVRLPEYDRAKITVGIVHFGVGGFHRAHQALVIDRLLEQGLATEWGICGVGVLPGDLQIGRRTLDEVYLEATGGDVR